MKSNKYHHVHCVVDDDVKHHLKHLLKKVEHKHYAVSLTKQKSNIKLFWNRFINRKINLILLSFIILFTLFLIFTSLFYPYSSKKTAISNPLLLTNLPKFYSPIVEKNLPVGEEYNMIKNIANLSPHRNIIISEKQILGFIQLKYNPYELLYATLELGGNKMTKLNFLLGTNENGIDNFSLIINSILWTIIISLFSLFIGLLVGTLLGSFVAYYSEKTSVKIGYYTFSSLSILPYLIFSIFLFSIFKFSILSSIIIFSLLSSINFFHSSYASGLEIKNKEFIIADKASGFNNWNIIIRDLFKYNWWNNIVIISDQLSLIFLSLAALAFFNINGVSNSNNIGLIFKKIISDVTNFDYLFTVIFLSILYLILTKWLSISLYVSSNPKLK